MTDVAAGGAPDAAEPTRGSRVRLIGLAFLLGLAGMQRVEVRADLDRLGVQARSAAASLGELLGPG